MESNKPLVRPKLWTKSFILAFISGLCMFLCVYVLVPILPFYLIYDLGCTESQAGVVLSLYTVMALLVRPFSGSIIDKSNRKKLSIVCFILFSIFSGSYLLSSSLALFVILRSLHGMTFGINTVSVSTLAIDILPSERRGEGIGYFGLSATVAMAAGPMIGFWLYDQFSFVTIFAIVFALAIVGVLALLPIKLKIPEHQHLEEHPHIELPRFSLDRFVLVKALPCVAFLTLIGYSYGVVCNFIGLYAKSVSFEANAGYFFLLLAIGILISRIISAKLINSGQISKAVYLGGASLLIAFLLFVICNNSIVYYLVALIAGLGYGYTMPSFQTMIVNLAHHNQRGTASATYFTFLDLGIATGIATGGAVIDHFGFTLLLSICTLFLIVGALYFRQVSSVHYQNNKLV